MAGEIWIAGLFLLVQEASPARTVVVMPEAGGHTPKLLISGQAPIDLAGAVVTIEAAGAGASQVSRGTPSPWGKFIDLGTRTAAALKAGVTANPLHADVTTLFEIKHGILTAVDRAEGVGGKPIKYRYDGKLIPELFTALELSPGTNPDGSAKAFKITVDKGGASTPYTPGAGQVLITHFGGGSAQPPVNGNNDCRNPAWLDHFDPVIALLDKRNPPKLFVCKEGIFGPRDAQSVFCPPGTWP